MWQRKLVTTKMTKVMFAMKIILKKKKPYNHSTCSISILIIDESTKRLLFPNYIYLPMNLMDQFCKKKKKFGSQIPSKRSAWLRYTTVINRDVANIWPTFG